jgi:hypothetical protein
MDNRTPGTSRHRSTLLVLTAVYLGTAAANGVFTAVTGALWHVVLAILLLAAGLVLLAVATRRHLEPRSAEDWAGSHSGLHPLR